MNAFIVFTKKELMESFRTYRFVILLVVFAIIGIMNPMLALMLPSILSGVDLGGGVTMTLPDPTAMDAWTQFFSNVGQLGMWALIILFCGIMANEFSRGTLVNLLAKGLSRNAVILSKFTAASLIWTLAYLLCLGITTAYTAYFWELAVQNPIASFIGPWLFGLLLIALLLFGGTLFQNFYGSLALTIGSMLLSALLSHLIPSFARYNPMSLSGATLALLDGTQTTADFIPVFLISTGAIAALIALSMVVFKRKRL